jgi:hypothetical protein
MTSKTDLPELNIIIKFIIPNSDAYTGWEVGKHIPEEVYFTAGGFTGSV